MGETCDSFSTVTRPTCLMLWKKSFPQFRGFSTGCCGKLNILISNDPAGQLGNCHIKYWLLCYNKKYRKSSEFFHSLVENYWQKMAGLGGTWAPVVSPAHQHSHHTRKRRICQVSYDTHARCIIRNAYRRVWCILPAGRRVRCIRPAWCGGLRCIRPARPDAHIPHPVMHKDCGSDAQIPRSTAATYESLRSTSQQIIKISEYYVDICAILW